MQCFDKFAFFYFILQIFLQEQVGAEVGLVEEDGLVIVEKEVGLVIVEDVGEEVDLEIVEEEVVAEGVVEEEVDLVEGVS